MTAIEAAESSTKKPLRSFADCAFNRTSFAERLTNTIEFYTQYEQGAYVLSLNAAYGAGKTTFLEMWQRQLQDNGKKVISINAWESDMEEDPTLAIADALLAFFEAEQEATKDKGLLKCLTKVVNSFKALGTLIYVGGNQIFSDKTGIDIDAVAKEVKATANGDLRASEINELKDIGEKLFERYRYKKKLYKHLQESLLEYIEALGEGNPLIIMVDELDRVRPTYAVKFLEAIKHIFSVKGVCFVLAVHKGQLEKSIRQLYGDIDFENYYLRFITKEVAFEEVQIADYGKFIDIFCENRFSSPNDDYRKKCLKQNLEKNCLLFKLNPRQVEYIIRTVLDLTKQDQKFSKYIDMLIFLLSLKLKDEQKIFEQLLNGKLAHKALYQFVISLFSKLNDNEFLYSFQKENHYPNYQQLGTKEHFLSKVIAYNHTENKDDDLISVYAEFTKNLQKETILQIIKNFRNEYYTDYYGGPVTKSGFTMLCEQIDSLNIAL